MLKISNNVYHEIIASLGTAPIESGGVLGAKSDGIVTKYYFDKSGMSSPQGYSPDVSAINSVLSKDWMPQGIYMTGIIHSHNSGNKYPSCMDIGYGARILGALDTVTEFYIPIFTLENETPNIACYKICYSENNIPICVPCKLEIINF